MREHRLSLSVPVLLVNEKGVKLGIMLVNDGDKWLLIRKNKLASWLMF